MKIDDTVLPAELLRPPMEPDGPVEPAEPDNRLLWAGLFFSLAIFAKFPRLDLAVTQHYYQQGVGFIYKLEPWVVWSYDWTPWIGRALVLCLTLFWAFNRPIAWLLDRLGRNDYAQQCTGPWRRLAAIAVICSLVGPGLVIEGGFKNWMGRPRPVNVVELGGTQVYHGPFEPGDNPGRHKSFVSSHAAAGFALMTLGLTCQPVWRRRWLMIGLATGAVVGLGRMLQGGHFLSDIIFAFYAVWLSCELVMFLDHRLRRDAPQP